MNRHSICECLTWSRQWSLHHTHYKCECVIPLLLLLLLFLLHLSLCRRQCWFSFYLFIYLYSSFAYIISSDDSDNNEIFPLYCSDKSILNIRVWCCHSHSFCRPSSTDVLSIYLNLITIYIYTHKQKHCAHTYPYVSHMCVCSAAMMTHTMYKLYTRQVSNTCALCRFSVLSLHVSLCIVSQILNFSFVLFSCVQWCDYIPSYSIASPKNH